MHNVVFVPGQPANVVPRLLARADIVLNSGMNHPLVEHDFPAKTVEYLAAGKPIISCGQSRWLMEESQAGVLIPPEDPDALATAVRRLYEDPKRVSSSAPMPASMPYASSTETTCWAVRANVVELASPTDPEA